VLKTKKQNPIFIGTKTKNEIDQVHFYFLISSLTQYRTCNFLLTSLVKFSGAFALRIIRSASANQL
jgi:hypothetical protein